MALSNYERQKKWREKNRATFNLRRRNARKGDNESLPPVLPPKQTVITKLRDEDVGAMNCVECGGYEEHRDGCSSMHPVSIIPKQAKLDELRALVKAEQEKPATVIAAKPLIFRNDYGNVITERAWNQLQEKKRKAKEGGYVIDDYSQ